MTTDGPAARSRSADWGTNAFLVVVAILVLAPIYWIVSTSVKPTSEILVTPTTLLTTSPTLEHYATALLGDFRSYLLNSLIAAGGATAIGIVLSVPAAWGFAKFAYPGSNALLSFTVITRVFPPIALALPFFLQFRAWGLIDTPLGLVIGYLPIVLPLMIWILTGFFRDFPDELVEAARIDGLGTLGILARIVVPLSLPGLGVAVLFGFLVAWNEFVIALTITRTPAAQTMPVGISTLITQFQVLWGEMMAVAAIYLLPVLAITLLTQRGLVRGLMTGATKGSGDASADHLFAPRREAAGQFTAGTGPCSVRARRDFPASTGRRQDPVNLMLRATSGSPFPLSYGKYVRSSLPGSRRCK